MSSSRRAIRYYARNPIAGGLILAVLFALSVFLSTTLLLYTSSVRAHQLALMNFFVTATPYPKSEAIDSYLDRPLLSQDNIQAIAELPEVKYLYYDYTTSLTFSEWVDDASVYIDGVLIEGSTVEEPLPFDNGDLTLLSGRFFTDDEIQEGSPVAIISVERALADGVALGDHLFYQMDIALLPEYDRTYISPNVIELELEVIGLFGPNEQARRFRDLIIPFELAWSLGTDIQTEFFKSWDRNVTRESMESQMMSMRTLTYVLNGPNMLESFDLKARTFLEPNYEIEYYAEGYDEIEAALSANQRITQLSFILAIITFIMVFVALEWLFIRRRTKDLAVMIASGERSRRIYSQLLVEMLLPLLLSAVTALPVAVLLAHNLNHRNVGKMDLLSLIDTEGVHIGQPYIQGVIESFDIQLNASLIIQYCLILIIMLVIAFALSSLRIRKIKLREVFAGGLL